MSQSKSHKENSENEAPQLHLERAPDTGSQREFDEVVPEFMHRAFYRSTEDEYQTVDTDLTSRLSRKSKELDQTNVVEAPPAAQPPSAPPKPLRSPEPAGERAPLEPLTPLRQSGSLDPEPESTTEDPVAVPLRTKTQPPEPPRPSQSASTTARSPGVNFSIVAALLFVVGLFIWREQTRPNIPPEKPLPIPLNSQVVQQENPEPPTLGEVSPYPEMSPRVEAPVVDDQPVEAVAEETSENLERAATLAEEAPADTTTYPSREASAQRAAIMQNMSDRTVTSMERASREAPVARPDDSLFPMDQPPARPVISTRERSRAMDANEAAATEATVSGSLFPTDTSAAGPPSVSQPNVTQPRATQPVATSKPPVAPKPPVQVRPPAQPIQGEPYEIAEPTF